MKYLQIAALVVAGAVGGMLIMKWKGEPAPATQTPPVQQAAPSPDTAPPVPQEPAASAPSAPAPAEPAPRATRAPARRKPSPVVASKPEREPKETAAAQPAAPAAPSASQPASEAAAPAPPAAAAVPPYEPPAPPPPRKVTINAGTLIPARTVEALSSDRNQPGDTFTATLDEPLVADGLVIAERGAKLEGRVVQSNRAGRVKGVSDLAIELTRLSTSDGQKVEIHTETFEKQGQTSKGSDAAKVGAAAGIGAAIGAIAGGGKGAGIGAAIGGAAGTGGVLATRGKPAAVSSETRINFRLSQPVTITEKRK